MLVGVDDSPNIEIDEEIANRRISVLDCTH
jgi:hypothetical protein